VAVHLPSKLYWNESSQALESTELARLIVEQEAAAGHARTLLVGDLNMNPFEIGMAGAVGLHGVMTRQLASRQTRTIQGSTHFSTTRCGHVLATEPRVPRGPITMTLLSMSIIFGH